MFKLGAYGKSTESYEYARKRDKYTMWKNAHGNDDVAIVTEALYACSESYFSTRPGSFVFLRFAAVLMYKNATLEVSTYINMLLIFISCSMCEKVLS